MSTNPIGIFDSGLGGLTVTRAIVDQLPHESIIYIGDTANGPYGPQPIEAVHAHSLAIADNLVDQGVKALVIACNTASAAFLEDARRRYDIPVCEVIAPAARRAAAATRTGKVGVIGTKATVESGAYPRAFAQWEHIDVTTVACPKFVDFVERGITSGRQILGVAQAYVQPITAAGVDTLVLGCTHYPLLSGIVQIAVGDDVTLVSSAEETAKDVLKVLTLGDILAGEGHTPQHTYCATGDPEYFSRQARRFLGPQIGQAVHIDVAK